jgi:hypothetical protein
MTTPLDDTNCSPKHNGLPDNFEARGEPSPFPQWVGVEFAALRSDLKDAIEPDKSIFEYANCILRALAWWVATAAAYVAIQRLHQDQRLIAYAGLFPVAGFGLLLIHQILMINRDFADRIAYRYYRRGRLGVAVALLVSSGLSLPFLGFVVLIGTAVFSVLSKA